MFGRVKYLAGFAAVLGSLTMLAPAAASAGLLDDVGRGVNDTVRNLDNTVGSLGGGTAGGGGNAAPPAPAPAGAPQPLDATTEPPISSTEPHATATALELNVPLIDQDVVVGRSHGEQDASGDYRGKVTVVSALGLEVAIETDEGEEENGLTGPLNDLLDDVCLGSGNNVCLTVLDARSKTTKKGSTNSFSAARADVGEGLVSASALESESEIEENGQCQTANGHSQVTNVSALGLLQADTLESNSSSFACRDGSRGAAGNSSLGGVEPLLQLSEIVGCDNTQESEFDITLVVTLAEGVCNGESTFQFIPANVQKALQLDLVPLLPENLVELVAASAETVARAPEPACPDPANPACDEDPRCANPPCSVDTKNADRAGRVGPGGRLVATADRLDRGALPFSGADLTLMALIGLGVMGGGLGAMALADRRRRAPAPKQI